MSKIIGFKEINQIDVSDNVQKKMNLSYLSWAWAHAEMKKIDEDAEITIHEFPDVEEIATLAQAGVEVTKDIADSLKINYKKDKAGAYVKVSVTLNGRTETEYLPVMDFKNKSMTNPSSMDVNKAHKRCFVKALALHGLGLYIYAGEDLPEQPPAKKINDTQLKSLNIVIDKIAELTDQTPAQAKKALLAHQKLPSDIKQLDEDQYGTFLRNLNTMKNKYEKKAKEEETEQTSLMDGNTTTPKGEK